MNSWAEFRKGGGGGGWNWDGPQKGKGSARVKGRRVWKKWSHRDDKSNFRSTRLHGEGRRGEPLPIVAFYMQSKAKLWRAETPRWPAHCATCWPEASLYHRRSWVDTYFYLNVFLCPSSSTFPPPLFSPPPWTAKFLRPPNNSEDVFLPRFGSWRNLAIFRARKRT